MIKKKRKNNKGGTQTEETNAKPQNTESEVVETKPVDMGLVREDINNLVGKAARDIAAKIIEAAREGQVTPAKYLFEAIGLYPATAETKAEPAEESLPYALLKRIAQAAELATCDDSLVPNSVASELGRTRRLETDNGKDSDSERGGQ